MVRKKIQKKKIKFSSTNKELPKQEGKRKQVLEADFPREKEREMRAIVGALGTACPAPKCNTEFIRPKMKQLKRKYI